MGTPYSLSEHSDVSERGSASAGRPNPTPWRQDPLGNAQSSIKLSLCRRVYEFGNICKAPAPETGSYNVSSFAVESGHPPVRLACKRASHLPEGSQALPRRHHCGETNNIQAPAATQAAPTLRATHRPNGVSFSRRTSSARSAIQSTFMTPPTNKSAIRTQQQPTQ